MMNAHVNTGWAGRLGSTARYSLIVLVSVLGVFMIGMIGGFSYAVIEDGRLPTKPLAYLIFAAIIFMTALVGWLLATLVRSLRTQTMSGFDRRYAKMWGIVVALSMPIGIALVVLGDGINTDFSSFLSNSPISALSAILYSAGLLVLLAVAGVFYHRTIDDHEERAYLWGSTITYYFLMLAFPLHWLLARGGLVPAMTIGIALLLVLLSCIVQAIVWALFKFR